MKKLILLLLTFTLIISCNLIEPCTLVIVNRSEFEIKIRIENSDINEFILEKGKGDVVYLMPGEIKIIINIEELNINKEYKLNIDYLEKKKFEFSADF
jgi:hypothetical protein